MIIISNEMEHAEKDIYIFHDREKVAWFIDISTEYFHISVVLW